MSLGSADGVLFITSKQILKSGFELRGTKMITGPESSLFTIFTLIFSIKFEQLSLLQCWHLSCFPPGVYQLGWVTNIRLVSNLLYIMNHYLPSSPV